MKLISYLYLAGGIFCGIVANGYFLKISEGINFAFFDKSKA